jgi:cytoskeletal protein CcmA (bactofilin family)
MGIFGKSDNRPPEPAVRPTTPAPAPAVPRSASSVIAAKTVIKGEVTGEENVVVEGTVEGQIRISRDLQVSQGGIVKATVSAASIVVAGEVIGDCQAHQRVELQASGRLTGNIRSPKVVIAEGAVFKGNSDMSGRKDERKEP